MLFPPDTYLLMSRFLLKHHLNEVIMTAPLEISHILPLHPGYLLIYFVFPHSIYHFLVFVYLYLVCLLCLFPTLECKLHKVKVCVFLVH